MAGFRVKPVILYSNGFTSNSNIMNAAIGLPGSPKQ
jgi:hypothetical protein